MSEEVKVRFTSLGVSGAEQHLGPPVLVWPGWGRGPVKRNGKYLAEVPHGTWSFWSNYEATVRSGGHYS